MASTTERRTVMPRATGGRSWTETRHSTKTTEFYAMIAVVAAILVAAWWVGRDTASAAADAFTAERAWLYVSIVASAYMIARGLAKSGSREPSTGDANDG